MTTMSPAATNFAVQLHRFSDRGLTGLVDNAADVNKLGELLASGHMNAETLRGFILKYQPLVGGEGANLQAYWTSCWSKLLGRSVEVPPVPNLRPKTNAAFREYGFRIMFIPVIIEDDYPDFFVRPKWGQHLTESLIKRRPLPGRWIAIETIAKPHWNAAGGYGIGDVDPLARALGLETRFEKSWNALDQTHLPQAAQLLGVSNKAVRMPSAEEWNLVGNLFNWLRDEQEEQLPDLGATKSWEWCENAYGLGGRLVVGDAESGGLAGVHYCWRDDGGGHVGFRVLVVL